MKKSTIFLAMIMISLVSFAQHTNEKRTLDKSYYLDLSKSQKQTAWLLLVAGAVVTTAGILVINHANNSSDFSTGLNQGLGGLLVITVGASGVLGGVGLFIISGQNARKAATLSLNNQRILFPKLNTPGLVVQPSVTLRLSLK